MWVSQPPIPSELTRYTDIPFPGYRYIPFRPDLPHPRHDPRGHSYAQDDEPLTQFTERDWPNCRPYLYGVDLFNHRYWWEAHEAWEAIWLAAGRNSQAGCFIQGLIQLAAGQLKRIMEEPSGASLLTDSAAEKLAVGGSLFLGIAVEPLSKS